MKKIEDYINIKELVIETVNDLNERYAEDIFEYISKTGDKCGGLIGNLFEKGVLRIAKKKAPSLELIHPLNDSELGDVYSIALGNGIELKFTLGWNNGQIAWSQSTIQSHEKDFLFIKGSIENCKLFIDFAYYGHMSYNDWTVHGKGMNVGPEKVQKFCERII